MSYHHILDKIFDGRTKIVEFKNGGRILQNIPFDHIYK